MVVQIQKSIIENDLEASEVYTFLDLFSRHPTIF